MPAPPDFVSATAQLPAAVVHRYRALAARVPLTTRAGWLRVVLISRLAELEAMTDGELEALYRATIDPLVVRGRAYRAEMAKAHPRAEPYGQTDATGASAPSTEGASPAQPERADGENVDVDNPKANGGSQGMTAAVVTDDDLREIIAIYGSMQPE